MRTTRCWPRLLVAVTLALAAPTALGACPSEPDALSFDVSDAIEAFLDWDWARFDHRLADVRADATCLSRPLTPSQSAALYTLLAFAAGRAGDDAAAVAAFRGVLAVDPAFTPDPALVASGSKLDQALGQARAAGPATPAPVFGDLWFVDGSRAAGVPQGRVALVATPTGSQTWLLDGGPLPADLQAALAPPAPTPAPAPALAEAAPLRAGASDQNRRSRQLAGAGFAVGTGAAICLVAVAPSTNTSFYATSDPDRARALYIQNHAAILGGGVLGAAAAGLVAGAALSGAW